MASVYVVHAIEHREGLWCFDSDTVGVLLEIQSQQDSRHQDCCKSILCDDLMKLTSENERKSLQSC